MYCFSIVWMGEKLMKRMLMFATTLIAVVAISHITWGASDQKIQITILSGRADMISGEDTFVQIDSLQGALLDKDMVKLNGQDVTAAFHPVSRQSWVGLVTGLKLGENSLEVFPDRKGHGQPAAELKLKDYPITGANFLRPSGTPVYLPNTRF
jgi:hypothetical protein